MTSQRTGASPPVPRGTAARSPAAWFPLGAALAVTGLAVYLTFIGYNESDDAFYAQGAAGWLAHAPYLGTSHWTLRHAIVLPMAAFFAVFGENEATLLMPSMIYMAALLAMLAGIVWRLGGPLAAALAVALVGTTPAIATGASLVSTDTPEAVFVIGSFLLWWHGKERRQATPFLLSGIAAGIAVITRETSVALPVFYVAAFLSGRGRDIRAYAIMAAGFVAVVGADWLYLYSMSGDPLYRIHVARAGVTGDGPQLEAAGENAAGVDRFGLVALPRWLRPLGVIFLGQSFGLLFWAGIPCAVWLAIGHRGAPGRLSAACLGLFACWLGILGYALAPWLWVIQRYYIVCVVLCVPMALALLRPSGHGRIVAAAVAAAVLAVNVMLDLGATTGIMAGEHAVVAVAASEGRLIHTDPSTVRAARWLLARAGLENRVTASPPSPGDLYFFNSRPRRGIPADWPIQGLPADQACLQRTVQAPKWTGRLVDVLHLGPVLPPGLRMKLQTPPLVTCLYIVKA